MVYGGQSAATKKSASTALCSRQSILIARDAHISSQHSLWYHTGEPVSATVGLFTPWKLANTTTRAFSSSSQERAAKQLQTCHWLYAINIFLNKKKVELICLFKTSLWQRVRKDGVGRNLKIGEVRGFCRDLSRN